MRDTIGFTEVPPVSLHIMVSILAGFMSFFSFVPITSHAAAPITPSGLNTHVDLSQTPPAGTIQYDITGGTRPGGVSGTNLFHSFGDFGVPANNVANFLNETHLPTNNILARVTGGDISNIFGRIQTTDFGNANLFLMNPAGFLFGPNATVSVAGMVAFTSADYLRLRELNGSNAGIFHADLAQTSVLTNAPVAAFGFLDSNPGAITIQGSQFSVTAGQSISLVGGNITIGSGTPDGGTAQPARLSAPNGKIQLASAASLGEFDAATLQPLPNVDGASFTSFGSVSLAPGSNINVSGASTVSIRGGQFVLSVNDAVLTTANTPGGADSITLSRGSSIITSNAGPESGADVQIIASKFKMEGASIRSSTTSGGAGGNIVVSVLESISLSGQDALGNPSRIRAETSAGGGVGGTIQINSPRASISLTDRAEIETLGLGAAAAGNIGIDSSTLSITGGAGIGTSGSEIAISGNIDITAHTSIFLSGSFNSDTPSRIVNQNGDFGGTGTTTISTGTLSLENGARILSDTFFDVADLSIPKINITADSLTLSNGSRIDVLNILSDIGALSVSAPTISLSNQSVISTLTDGDGNAGPINLSTNNFSLSGGSQVISSTFGAGTGGKVTIQGFGGEGTSLTSFMVTGQDSTGNASGIFTTTTATGKGGDIDIAAQSFTVRNGGAISAATSGAEPSATGGTITVNAGQVNLTNGGLITASSTGLGNAGNISINAGQRLEMRDSSITTQAAQASGGKIDIRAVDLVRLVNSSISTSVLDGTGGGGDIFIDPNSVVLQNSQILAQAVQGAGGNITIFTPLFLADSSSFVSASSQFGLNGTVTIQSPTSNLSESLGTLPSEPGQVQTLLTQRCAALANGQTSSFVVAGREQLPADPGGWLSGPIALVGIDAERIGEGTVAEGTSHLEPRTSGLLANDRVSLRRLTPAGFLMANFADSEATGCRS